MEGFSMRFARSWVCLLTIALSLEYVVGCDKPGPPSASSAEKKVLDSLDCPAVAVGNGQAVLLKVETGYGLLIPHIQNRYEGSYELLYSASGNFKVDAVPLQNKSGRFSDMKPEIKGHHLTLYGESEQSIWVQLTFGDKKILIASVHSSDPKNLDLSKIRFERTTEATSEDWSEYLREKGIVK
jgi:hypothetical protein